MFDKPHTYSDNALTMYKKLYFNNNETKIEEVHDRVAATIANNKTEYETFLKLLNNGYFRPNTPCLINSNPHNNPNFKKIGIPDKYDPIIGTNDYLHNLAACFVIGLDDSMESIIDMWKICASVYAGGGGVGIPLSNLREKNSPIKSGGFSSGALTYLKVVQSISDTVKSGGKSRRAANLTSFKVNHPDILEYIECKEHNNLSAINISVLIPDWFMEHVENKEFDKIVDLISPNGNKKVGEITVGKIWNAIIEHAHKTGDPGVLFYDESNRKHAFPSKGEILSTNPCLPGWSLVLTNNGYRFFKDINNIVILNNTKHKCSNLIKTSNCDIVYEIITESGFSLYMTKNHKISTPNGDIPLKNLQLGDKVICQINNILNKINTKLFSYGFNDYIKNKKLDINSIFGHKSNISYQFGYTISYLLDKINLFNFDQEIKFESDKIDCKLVQVLLSSFGVKSSILINNNIYSLIIEDNFALAKLFYKIKKETNLDILPNDIIDYLNNKYDIISKNISLNSYEFIDTILSITEFSKEPVYDIKVPGVNHFITSGVIVHNCGEVTLPDFSMCNLASINLLKFINNGEFDFKEFKHCIFWVVTFLDNVIDKTQYPHPKFKDRMLSERPIGLGIMGLSHLFYQLGIRYGSKESIELFEKICKTLTLTAIRASIKLAHDSNNSIEIPDQDRDHFIKRLIDYGCTSDDIDKFNQYGIKNSTWTSIAPTGCVKGDTLILTDEGLLNIFEIYNLNSKENESKIISNKNWKTTNDLFIAQPNNELCLINGTYFNHIDKVISIKTELGYKICGTSEHRIKVVNSDGQYVWKYLNEISKTDLIPITYGQHWSAIPFTKGFESINIDKFKILNQQTAYIFGYIISNCVEKDETKFKLIINNINEYKSIINMLLSENSINPVSISENETWTTFEYNITDLDINFINLNYINQFIRKSPSLVILAFLQGLYFGIINRIDIQNKDILLKDDNLENLELIQQLYLTLGFITKIENDELKMIYNKEYIEIPEMFCYNPSADDLDVKIKQSIKSIYQNTINEIPENCILLNIDSIEENNEPSITFDISVPRTETYIANGFVSHNSISIAADSSYAFEPEMAIIWSKQLVDSDQTLYFVNKYFEEACKKANVKLTDELKNKISLNKGSVQNIEEIPEEIRNVFVTAFDVGWKKKIEMQAAGQKYISLAISSTCNLPNEATLEDVNEAYLMAWKNKLKGITVYRDGSLSFQPVNFGGNDKLKNNKKIEEDKNSCSDEIQTSCPKMKRPIVRLGKTIEIKTPHGRLYLTGNVDKNGKMFELFLNMGKQGELINLLLNAFSRIFSKALQYNIPLEDLTNTIRHTNGLGFFVKLSEDDEKSEFAESIIDAIGLILETHFNNKEPSLELKDFIKRTQITIVGEKCPECGQYTLTHTSGCRGGSCSSCGYSACQ